MTRTRRRKAHVPSPSGAALRRTAAPLVPIRFDTLSTRPPEQQQFEQALGRQAARIAALRGAVRPWGCWMTDPIVEATIFHCGLYYLACLPNGAPRRSRATLKAEIAKAVDLADRLVTVLRPIWNARDPTVHSWLAPVIGTPGRADDGVPSHPLDPALLYSLDALWRVLALLDRALPADVGGTRRAIAFTDLVNWLAGIYCEAARVKVAPLKTKGHFFRYVASVADLLRSVAGRFPAAAFDLPGNDEALRKALSRMVSRRT